MGVDLFLDRSEPAYQDTDEYSEDVRERMQKAYQLVSDQLKVTFDRAIQRYDQRVRAVHFPLNSHVWFYCPRLTACRGQKFKKMTNGPYRIVRILNDVNYVIQKVPGARLQICHVDRLLRYEGEGPPVWIRFDQENQNDLLKPRVPQKASDPIVVFILQWHASSSNLRSLKLFVVKTIIKLFYNVYICMHVYLRTINYMQR